MVDAATTSEVSVNEETTNVDSAPVDEQAIDQVGESSSRENLMNGSQEAPAEFSLPDQFKDHKLFDGIDTMDKLTGRLDWLSELRGKKGIPEQNTPEAWQGFVDNLGEGKDILQDLMGVKPQAPEEYKFSEIEGYNDDGITDPFFNEMFKKYNIDQDTADAIRRDTIENYLEVDKAEKKRISDEFDTMATAEWGTEWEKELAGTMVQFQDVFNEDQRKMMETMPNEILVPLLKYMKSSVDGNQNFNGVVGMNGQSNGMNNEQLVNRYKELDSKKHQGGRFLKEFNEFRDMHRNSLAKAFNLDKFTG